MVSSVEQKLAGQPTSGDEEEVAFCLCQVDAANAMLTQRQDAMLELSRKPYVFDEDLIF